MPGLGSISFKGGGYPHAEIVIDSRLFLSLFAAA